MCQGKGTRQMRHSLPCAGPGHTTNEPLFVVCLGQGTRQRCCVCRVPRPGHTTKGLCLQCANPLRHTANRMFNGFPTSALYFAVGPIMHTAQCLPCARNLAHDKLALCRPLFAVSCLPCVTLGKHFAECKPAFAVCRGHTANRHSPVVMLACMLQIKLFVFNLL